MRPKIINNDALNGLRELPDESVQTCVTSPPYWGLRDYGNENQIGLESSPEGYVNHIVEIFREVRRVLKPNGTVWLNIGDCYYGGGGGGGGATGSDLKGRRNVTNHYKRGEGLKKKDLVGIPWLTAFGLRDDGWYLRSDIIWHKPNPIPESVTDRPTRAHEMIFLLSKSPDYYYDIDAIREELAFKNRTGSNKAQEVVGLDGKVRKKKRKLVKANPKGRNVRSVWPIPISVLRNAHIAVFPEEIPEKCILASTKPGDIVLDPFLGSGTTCLVASRLNRNSVGIELSEEFYKLAQERCLGGSQSLQDFL